MTFPQTRVSSAWLPILCLAGLTASRLAAQPPANAAPARNVPPVVRITLEEAKQRALSTSKLLGMASLNAESKAYAIRAMRAMYFPQVTGTAIYVRFQDDLGTVLTTPGRTVTGPLGRPLVTFPTNTINAAVLNQDTSIAIFNVAQPITDLLKVRQGVRIAQADQGIAQAEWEKGIRELASGVEQLYWGLLAVGKIRAGAIESVKGAEMLAGKVKSLEARLALVEARQGLQQVEKQVADLQEQLNGLLDLPLCTQLELVSPPLPVVPFQCADDVINLALGNSPEIRSAQQTIAKADAAVRAGKLDYVPSVAIMGGYVNQTGASYIQQDIGYIGAFASYTFWDWGKRRAVIRERQSLRSAAGLKLQQTEDEIRQKAVKAFREIGETQEAVKIAGEMVELRQQVLKKAMEAPDVTAVLKASKDLSLSQVDFVKAELAFRQAYVQIMSLVGDPSILCPSGHGS